MSVVVQRSQEQPILYLKGNPEVVKTLCIPETIPSDFDNQLRTLTLKGNRILAAAYKDVKNLNLDRLEQEKDLSFLGFIELVNPLKTGTVESIGELIKADIHVAMITGDNLLTAAAVAKHCNILPSDDPYCQIEMTDD